MSLRLVACLFAGLTASLVTRTSQPAIAATTATPDWTFNLAFTGWAAANSGDRYRTFTPESADARAREIAEAGFGAVITNGYHFRLNFASRDDDIRRAARTIADACHRHGLRVIEHHDWTIGYYDAYPLVFDHADWLQVDARDMLTRHRIFCMNNPEFEAAYADYLCRWQRQTNYDGYQLDEIQYLSRGYCGCRHCRARYQADTGRDFPPVHEAAFWLEEFARDDYRHWMRWRAQSLGDFRERMARKLRAIRPDIKMFNYTTALQSSAASYDRGAILELKGRSDDTFGAEVNSVLFAAYPYVYATMKSRLALGEAFGKPSVALNGQTRMNSYFVWAFGRTCRASLWYHLATHADGPPQRELLRWPYQMDDAVSRSAADVGIYHSAATRDLGGPAEDYSHEFEGWLQGLAVGQIDARIVLGPQALSQLAQQALYQPRLIVLPNVRALTAEESQLLTHYAGRGGRLLLVGNVGTLAADGRPKRWPLASRQDAANIEPAGHCPPMAVRPLGRGRVYYLSRCLGALAFEGQQLPTSEYQTTFQPAKDPAAADAMAAAVDRALADVPRYRLLGGPRGLLAPIYATRRDGKPCRAIHLLNASGRSLRPGDRIESSKDQPLPMPPLPELSVELAGNVGRALLATPERPGHIELAARPTGGVSRFSIPAKSFTTYGVVYAWER